MALPRFVYSTVSFIHEFFVRGYTLSEGYLTGRIPHPVFHHVNKPNAIFRNVQEWQEFSHSIRKKFEVTNAGVGSCSWAHFSL